MDDFEIELKQGFLEEAAQSLADTEQCFLAMDTDPDNIENLNKIFRLAHNLKGSSKAVGFNEMGAFTHEFESFILKIKNKELVATPNVISVLLRSNDHLIQMVTGLRQDLNAQFDSSNLLSEMKSLKEAILEECNKAEVKAEVKADVTLEGGRQTTASVIPDNTNVIAIEPNLELLAELEAELKAKTTTPITQNQISTSVQPVASTSTKANTQAQVPEESLRISVSKLDKLLNFIGEMVILQSVLVEQSSKYNSVELVRTVRQLGKVGKDIQDISMGLRMVPVKPTFQKMQRIVRDTAQAVKKDVVIALRGEETEVDKTVLEKINDPLVHLIRNSVDHGVEAPEKRELAGKSRKGTVKLSAFHKAGKLVIEVEDDGGGLNVEVLKKKALEKGIINESDVLSENEAFNLIFAPGFSTKEVITDVSGRGVGMDVVKTNIRELSGEISIDSVLGKGTKFTITLPLTLAIIDGMVLSYSAEKFVIPLSHVHETLRPTPDRIKKTQTLGEVLLLRGENIPIFKLGDFFAKKAAMPAEQMIALVIRTGPEPFAILVEDIVGRYQVVIKQLDYTLDQFKGISGTTILGDGKPALILEPLELLKRKIFNIDTTMLNIENKNLGSVA